MAYILDGMGIVLGVVMALLLLAWLGFVNIPPLYPLSCSTTDKKLGTIVRKDETGFPAPRYYCRAD